MELIRKANKRDENHLVWSSAPAAFNASRFNWNLGALFRCKLYPHMHAHAYTYIFDYCEHHTCMNMYEAKSRPCINYDQFVSHLFSNVMFCSSVETIDFSRCDSRDHMNSVITIIQELRHFFSSLSLSLSLEISYAESG